MKPRGFLLAFFTALLFASAAAASTIVTIPPGTVLGGQPVSAQATFTIFDNALRIELENLESNPTSVIQNLSDLAFAFSTGQTSGTLESSTGIERTVSSGGTFSDGAVVDTGWALEAFALSSGTGLRLYLLGTSTAPVHTIIGPPGSGGLYSGANGSIAGNPAHNPFLAGPVTFTLSVPGLPADFHITAVRFSFGTTEGTFFEQGIVPPSEIPEPGSVLLAGIGAALLLLRRRYSR